jgi:hypothetical protein
MKSRASKLGGDLVLYVFDVFNDELGAVGASDCRRSWITIDNETSMFLLVMEILEFLIFGGDLIL